MAYAILNRFPGGTKDNYDKVASVVHPSDGLPAGQTHHFAGPVNGDWQVIAIWESKGDWERFRDETLMPALQQGLEGAFESPPQIVEYELDTVLAG